MNASDRAFLTRIVDMGNFALIPQLWRRKARSFFERGYTAKSIHTGGYVLTEQGEKAISDHG